VTFTLDATTGRMVDTGTSVFAKSPTAVLITTDLSTPTPVPPTPTPSPTVPTSTPASRLAAAQAIINNSCVGCHAQFKDLSDAQWATAKGNHNTSITVVVPGNPSGSPLFSKLMNNGINNTGNMPYNGSALQTAQISTIKDWIAGMATSSGGGGTITNQMACSINGQQRSGLPTANANFVAVGYATEIWSSADGKSWTQSCQTVQNGGDDDSLLRDVTFANGKFVAVGGSGISRIMISYDGYRWEDHSILKGGSWLGGIAYGNGVWIAVGGCGIVARSTDTVTWTTSYPVASGCQQLRSVYFNGGKFYAQGDNNGNFVSSDGVSWSSGTGPGAPQGTRRISVGNNNSVQTSADGGATSTTTKVGSNYIIRGAARN